MRTRSSSNLLYNVGNSSSSDSTPTQSPNPSASSHSVEQQENGGVEDTDGPLQTTETLASVNCVDSTSKEVTSDGGGIGLVSGSSSSLEDGDGGVGGSENGEGDMEEVYTLLDSTLHMEAKAEEEDGGSCRQEEGGKEGRVLTSLHPGRLKERIAALRRYCCCYSHEHVCELCTHVGSVRVDLVRTQWPQLSPLSISLTLRLIL